MMGVCVGFWVLLWTMDIVKDRVAWLNEGSRPWAEIIQDTAPWWIPWILLTPVFPWIARRLVNPDAPRTSWWLLAWTPALALVHLGLTTAAYEFLFSYLGRGDVLGLAERFHLVGYGFWLFDFLTAGALLLILFTMQTFTDLQERAVAEAQADTRAAELSSRVADARLDALRSQLDPHFLFNTLNSIGSLIEQRHGSAAQRMLMNLSGLLRTRIATSPHHVVPLGRERQFLEQYIGIEQMRFGNMLQVTVDIPDALHQAQVPELMLQPLVENAIRHGRRGLKRPLHVSVTARQHHDRITVRIEDDGAGFHSDVVSEGVGLSNTRERLQLLYADRATLSITPRAPRGTLVTIELPYQRATKTPSEGVSPAAATSQRT